MGVQVKVSSKGPSEAKVLNTQDSQWDDDVSLQEAFFLPIPAGSSQWHLESFLQHMISPCLREAAGQGYIRAKNSPIAVFVCFSLS